MAETDADQAQSSGILAQSRIDSLLQRLQGVRQGVPLRLADEKVDVLRHYDISIDAEAEAATHALERTQILVGARRT
jgi:hypothetical protein